MQGERVGPGGKVTRSGDLPCPFFAVGSENLRKFDAVDFKRETSCGSAAFPDRGPVAGACPDYVVARFDDFDNGFRIGDGDARAVRHQIGGAHFVHGGGVDHPPAGSAEGFRFQKQTAHGNLRG